MGLERSSGDNLVYMVLVYVRPVRTARFRFAFALRAIYSRRRSEFLFLAAGDLWASSKHVKSIFLQSGRGSAEKKRREGKEEQKNGTPFSPFLNPQNKLSVKPPALACCFVSQRIQGATNPTPRRGQRVQRKHLATRTSKNPLTPSLFCHKEVVQLCAVATFLTLTFACRRSGRHSLPPFREAR